MSKAIKELLTAEYRQRWEGVRSACLVDLSGMNVQEQENLRRSLRDKSATLSVFKNRLAKRVFQASPLEPMADVLQGPCALVTSSGSIIDAAKVLVDAAEQFAALSLKQAIFEGDPNLLTVEEVSRFKSQSELIGEVAMLIASPGRSVAGCLSSPQSKIAGCLKSLIDRAA